MKEVNLHRYKRKSARWRRANGPRQHLRVNKRFLENKCIELKDTEINKRSITFCHQL